MRLQRITSSGRWIPEIDSLRFIAIFAVIVVHGMGPLLLDPRFAGALTAGHPTVVREMYHLGRGVQLFFIISGFILAQPFLRQFVDGGNKVNLKKFYLRRVTRLEPPYILSLLLYASGIELFRHGLHKNVGFSLLTSLGYVHNFFHGLEPINNSTWSLELEIQFYLLAPLISFVYLLRPTQLRRALLLGAIVLFSTLPHAAADRLGFYLAENFSYFLIGYLMADLRIHQVSRWKSVFWDCAAAILWPSLFLLPETAPPIFLNIILTFCFMSAFLGPLSRRILQTQWIALVGGMCYSIYLLHDLVIGVLYPVLKHLLVFRNVLLDYAMLVLLLVPPILIVSTVYFVLVERPCMDPAWPQKVWRALNRREEPPDVALEPDLRKP